MVYLLYTPLACYEERRQILQLLKLREYKKQPGKRVLASWALSNHYGMHTSPKEEHEKQLPATSYRHRETPANFGPFYGLELVGTRADAWNASESAD